MPPLLQLRDIPLTLGGAPLLDGAELSISTGDRITLVGRNGSGKSTLFRIAAGLLQPDGGTRFVQPSARLAYLPQEPDFSGFETAFDYVLAGLASTMTPMRRERCWPRLGSTWPPLRRGFRAARRGGRLWCGFWPRARHPASRTSRPTISISWRSNGSRRCSSQCRSALALISHDKRLLADLTRATIWLDRGPARRLDQGFAAFEAWRDLKLEEEEIERHELDRKIVDEEHWMRYGVTARRKRNMRRVDEFAALSRERREAPPPRARGPRRWSRRTARRRARW